VVHFWPTPSCAGAVVSARAIGLDSSQEELEKPGEDGPRSQSCIQSLDSAEMQDLEGIILETKMVVSPFFIWTGDDVWNFAARQLYGSNNRRGVRVSHVQRARQEDSADGEGDLI
jgi:hypothetical protein